MDRFGTVEGFEWDTGNSVKSWGKHGVSPMECEDVFFNDSLIVQDDEKHSSTEKRFCALGKTGQNRKLFVAFTVRSRKIRVISARDMSRKERAIYEEAERNPEI